MLPGRREPLLDTSPEIPLALADNILLSGHRHLRGAAFRLLRRASSRRMMLREPSVRVRESAAEQLEERQGDWAYSKPIIVLDVLWNLAFVAVSAAVLLMSLEEEPEVPLRLWVVGYALQCVLHAGCVISEYRRRRRWRRVMRGGQGRDFTNWASGDSSSGLSSDDGSGYEAIESLEAGESSVAKHLESVNTMLSFLWWVVGFFWVTVGGQNLSESSPQLYWLCLTFLAFDVLFVIICVAVACLVGIAVCCCLPCIIGILYAMTEREGATTEEVERLPKFRFHRAGGQEKIDGEIQESSGGMMTQYDVDTPAEHAVSSEDAECCICLQPYDDGTDLRELPCHHHFHSTCIDKWLYVNATCPLCKLNILKANTCSDKEDV